MDAYKKRGVFLKRILSIYILAFAGLAAVVIAAAGEASAAVHLAGFTPDCPMVIPRDIPQSQKAYYWNGSGYVQTAELRPGYGYFLATDFPASELTIPECAADVSETGYTVALTKGWNLVGAPKSKTAAFPTLFNKLPAGFDKYIFDTAGLSLTPKTRSTVAAGGVYWLYVEDSSNISVPPVISTPSGDGDYILTPAVSTDKSDPSKVTVLLSAIMDSATGSPVMNLTKDNFKIYEGSEERGIDSVKPMAGNPSQSDIVFIMDVTGSMGEQINGVKNSVTAFVDYLAGTGQDVRLGAVTFGDAVVDSFALSTNTVYFKGFFSKLKRVSGEDLPENPLDAVAYAVENFNFRIEAQKIFIIITDAAMHKKGDSLAFADTTIPYAHTAADILGMVKHRYVTHVVNMSYVDSNSTGLGENARVLSSGTGGAALDLAMYGNSDLTKLPIKGILSSGYIITYTTGSPGGGAARTAADAGTSRKLVTNIGGLNKGEVNF